MKGTVTGMDYTRDGETDTAALTTKLDDNIKIIGDYFRDNKTMIKRPFCNRAVPSIRFCIFYTDGMIDNMLMNEDIIRPLMEYKFAAYTPNLMDVIANQVTFANDVTKTSDIEQLLISISYGDTVLMTEGTAEALILNTKGWTTRSLSEPDNEQILKGPREGFNESIMTNLSLVRRRLRTPDLKMKFRVFGTRSKTNACICYLDSVVNKNVLRELEKRLDRICIDGTLDVNYLAENVRDAPYSPIRTTGTTERPDIVAARLLEGRVAVFLDGSPVVMTVPYLFVEQFQSNEDYYVNYYFATLGRWLRYLAFFISTSIPAIYLALVTFHHEMVPTSLTSSIAMARMEVPFPTGIELVIMLIFFELLRESGSRMPGNMGQALGIVGALVIGQAAVEAKLVSAPVIIIVALTGICGLMVPNVKSISIIMRFGLLACAAVIGLYGYLLGLLVCIAHLYSICSFGIPVMTSGYYTSLQDKKDTTVRAPWWYMLKRPRRLSDNRTRQSSGDER